MNYATSEKKEIELPVRAREALNLNDLKFKPIKQHVTVTFPMEW